MNEVVGDHPAAHAAHAVLAAVEASPSPFTACRAQLRGPLAVFCCILERCMAIGCHISWVLALFPATCMCSMLLRRASVFQIVEWPRSGNMAFWQDGARPGMQEAPTLAPACMHHPFCHHRTCHGQVHACWASPCTAVAAMCVLSLACVLVCLL